MKSQAILLSSTQDLKHPFVQDIPPDSHFVAIWVISRLPQYGSACVQVTLILLHNGPKAQE